MESGGEKSRILIFGSSGYLGTYLTKASISMGFPTYAYLRPLKTHAHPSKLQLLQDFQSMGVTIYHGELDEHEKLVCAVKEVDIVISALPVPQHLHQIKIICAMKEAGNVKRFIPSEFGNEVDRVKGALPPFQKLLDNKQRVRRATEEAGIPFTYISANSFASYFVSYLLHPHDRNSNQVTVYGTGEAKGSGVQPRRRCSGVHIESSNGPARCQSSGDMQAASKYNFPVGVGCFLGENNRAYHQ